MGWEAWVTLATIGLIAFGLLRNLAAPETLLLGALALLMTLGAIPKSRFPDPSQMVAGFGNEGLIVVGVLFVVAAGLSQTGAMQLITKPLLGQPRHPLVAQTRLMLPVGVLSAFLNNTPIVAMFMPVVSDWCKKSGMAPSKLFIPLSYAAILGGMCTLIGTSTNLVVNGLLSADPTVGGMGLFEIGAVGLPCAIVGLIYMLVLGRWLLPRRQAALSAADDPRQYTVEMIVEPGSALIGQTIEQAGLRHLPQLYLIEIDRDGEAITAVPPTEVLRPNDRLVFVGVVESVVDLRKMRGLTPATNQVFKINAPQTQRCLIEAVVSNSCPIVGRTIREGRFRTNYNAAVIAVARNGQRINRKIGDIELQPGDTLLLEAHRDFVEQQRNSRDFFLVSPVEGSTPPRHDKAPFALAILAGLVVAVAGGWLTMLNAAFIAAGAMVVTRCCTSTEAKRSVDWQVLLVIGAALGIGQVMLTTGAAGGVARGMLNVVGDHPMLVLLAVYVMTNLFTELMTNSAAAVLVYPIAREAAQSISVDFMPFAAVIMIAASAGFATPIGYQTNLMVFGPGGYRYSDYLKVGLPLNFLVMIVAVSLTPWIWPF